MVPKFGLGNLCSGSSQLADGASVGRANPGKAWVGVSGRVDAERPAAAFMYPPLRQAVLCLIGDVSTSWLEQVGSA